MLEIHTTSFIQRHILENSGQILLQKSEVRLSSKTTFQDERTNQLIVQNCRPHIDTKTQLKVAFHIGAGILICPHTRAVCIIDTVAIKLSFVSKQDVTIKLATAIEPLCKISVSEQNRQVREVALAARGMDACPLHAVFSTLSCGEHEDILLFFGYSHVNCSVPSEPSLTSRSAAMRKSGSVPVSRNFW